MPTSQLCCTHGSSFYAFYTPTVGTDTNIYIFDTGIYPDHSEWDTREPGISRLAAPLICAGTSTDYTFTDHGTHLASLAAGWTHGTGKSATIHPIQVLDANGEGSTASLLCGMEKLLQDGKDYNDANAPKKIRCEFEPWSEWAQ